MNVGHIKGLLPSLKLCILDDPCPLPVHDTGLIPLSHIPMDDSAVTPHHASINRGTNLTVFATNKKPCRVQQHESQSWTVLLFTCHLQTSSPLESSLTATESGVPILNPEKLPKLVPVRMTDPSFATITEEIQSFSVVPSCGIRKTGV